MAQHIVPQSAFFVPAYQPQQRVISGITRSNPVIITTTIAHQYINGTIVRIDVPLGQGMEQLNQQFGPITVTSSTMFTIPFDTTNYDTFKPPSGSFPPAYQQAQCVPFAELNGQLTAAVQNVLPL